jgi:hypothetical protein
MSSQPKSLREAQAGTVVPKARTRRKIDHAEIVRMAEAEAASRAAERREMIAIAAYLRAEKRGFEPGHELEDWYAAEMEVAEAQQRSFA